MSEQGAGKIVLIENIGALQIITMNRPERLNAFNLPMIVELGRALAEAAADDAVHVVLLTGAGRAFSSGADLDGMGTTPAPAAGEPAPAESFELLQETLEAFPKPIVAAVNGLGVGFGFTMLGYCDFVFIGQSARLRTPFSQLGLSPEGSSSYLFPLRMGWSAAARALMLGDWFSAEDVVRAGLAQEVVADDELMDMATAFAERLAQCPLQSLVATKGLMLQAHLPQIRQTRLLEGPKLKSLIGTPANKAALKAFAERACK